MCKRRLWERSEEVMITPIIIIMIIMITNNDIKYSNKKMMINIIVNYDS